MIGFYKRTMTYYLVIISSYACINKSADNLIGIIY